jgi:GNAT superfamily N-acetyltransferase
MVCRDVDCVPAVALPEGLMFRPVERLAPLEGSVPLVDAAAVAVAADSDIVDTPVVFARFLESLPGSVRLFAAIDEGGVVRATSGCDVFGEHTRVLFVNTDPRWRGRGIGGAMTAAALQAAARSGAQRAYLDATDVAVSLYRRLGFEAAGRSMRYVRSS